MFLIIQKSALKLLIILIMKLHNTFTLFLILLKISFESSFLSLHDTSTMFHTF